MFKDFEKCNNIVQYNTVIQDSFPLYNFYPSILERPLVNNCWNMKLPDVQNQDGIVLHTQDNLNITNDGIFPELIEIERFYSDKNINNIIVIHWNHSINEVYEGPLKLIEFPTHSFEFVQKFKNATDEWLDTMQSPELFKNKFMCLNGYPRKHRILVYDYLTELDIPSFVSISYNQDTMQTNTTYKNYNFDNTQNFINLLEIYNSSPVNIVTETMYYEPCGIITEKTLQAFGAMQLPIVIGYKGIVSDIKRHGFDMFDDIIDHSYDALSNNSRWKEAIDLNKHILNNEFDYASIYDRLKRNQMHLLSHYAKTLMDYFHKQVNEMSL